MHSVSNSRNPRILIYGSGIFSLGGGERYLFAVADALRPSGQVVLAGPELPRVDRLRKLGFPGQWPLEKLAIPDFTEASACYDVAIYQAVDPPPRSRAQSSYAIVQFPSTSLPGLRHPRAHFSQRRDLSTYQCVVYSEFVRHWLRELWHRDAVVLAPPVSLGTYHRRQKRPGILSVGRFFGSGHSKRQDVLIKAYTSLPREIRDHWPLTLAGGCGESLDDERFLAELRSAIGDHNVEIAIDVSPSELKQMYAENSLFWHSTGYGRSESAPGHAEHLGISTIEAMSYGCVPMVFADGGQEEIVDGTFGVLWRDIGQLIRSTRELISNPHRLDQMARSAEVASEMYSDAGFGATCRRTFGLA